MCRYKALENQFLLCSMNYKKKPNFHWENVVFNFFVGQTADIHLALDNIPYDIY